MGQGYRYPAANAFALQGVFYLTGFVAVQGDQDMWPREPVVFIQAASIGQGVFIRRTHEVLDEERLGA